MKFNPGLLFLLSFMVSACTPATPAPTPIATPTRAPGAVALLSTPRAAPTPLAPEETVTFKGLSISIAAAEINTDYKTEFGPVRDAAEGTAFLWIQLSLKSVDNEGVPFPDAEHFSALYGSREFKPTYGHREGYPDYTSLNGLLTPDHPQQAWLRFDVPATAALSDLRFAFLPESARVTFSRTQSGKSYYDHPVFLWRMNPDS